MMLSSINTELSDYNENVVNESTTDNNQLQPITLQKPAIAKVMTTPAIKVNSSAQNGTKSTLKQSEKPVIKEKPDFLKSKPLEKSTDKIKSRFNALNDSIKSTKTTTTRTSTFTRASSVVNTSSFQSSTTTSTTSNKHSTNGLSERLKSLDEMPNIYKKMEGMRKVSDSITIKRNPAAAPIETISSVSPPSHGGSAPWPVTNRRTKFRVTQMSRDVPVGSPNTHQTVFLEEAVNTTKDCLLHLLDKYNETETRTAYSNSGRHQSMSVGFGLSDNVEYRSMNSLNFFFQRHATAGNTVKQMQAQLESKRKQ